MRYQDITDFNSLDEEIKMNVVKLKKEKQKKVRALSKAIYIIARVCKIILIISISVILATMIVIPFISKNIKIIDNGIEIYGVTTEYKYENGELIIKYNNDEQYIPNSKETFLMKKTIDSLEKYSIYMLVVFTEVIFAVLSITLILVVYIMNHLEKLFINIYNGETPFTIENVKHIKKMAMIMIITTLLPNVVGIIFEKIIGEDLGIGFELMDLVYILFLYTMSYIFEYGYEIQLDSNGKMYGDE